MASQCNPETQLMNRLAIARACACLPSVKRVYLVFREDELLLWRSKLSAARRDLRRLPEGCMIVRFEPVLK
jgi:hypothetical protein